MARGELLTRGLLPMETKVRETFAERALRGKLSYSSAAFRGVAQELFPSSHELLPQINQVYELDLAYGEYRSLSDDDLIKRGAYFKSVRGTPTHHYRICMSTPDQVNASARQDRKNFFLANVFAVGYATHGLFPYRGKFHPQMIKAVMNMIGLKPGHTVLDPMAGCGTTAIEACIMGLDSIANELNPFACLMTRAKVGVLDTECAGFPRLLSMARAIYQQFAPFEKRLTPQGGLFESSVARRSVFDPADALPDFSPPMRELLALCYLDSVGYAARRTGKTPADLFPDLLSRYLAAVAAFNDSRRELGMALGQARVLEGDARELAVPDETVDGVLFSPPYSFAIDYVENDRPQLQFLGVNVDELKRSMVGLTGSGRTRQQIVESRVSSYFADMERVMRECHRVLRSGAYCVIIVGSNTNQTGGVSLENGLIEIGSGVGLPLEFQIMREIEGIRNTMRDEFLLFFRKPPACVAPGP
jgi:SAM-dependent methyltransferase